jgi:hypothetical protein
LEEEITMSNILIAKATEALKESVHSIMTCDDDDATKRFALAESFTQFQDYLERNGGADVAKARTRHDVGARGLAGAVSEHVLDMIDFHRRRLGIAKSDGKHEDTPIMDSIEKIAADGLYGLAKISIDDGHAHQIDEHRCVRLITDYAKRKHPELSGPAAFERVFVGDGEASRLLQKWHAICKAATANFDVTIVNPGDETERAVSDTENSAAYQALQALAGKLHEAAVGRGEKLTKEQAFARTFEQHPDLARVAHRSPAGGSTSYPMPNFSPEALGRRR